MSGVEAVSQRVASKCRQFESRFRAKRIPAMVRDFYLPDAVMEGRDLPAQVGHKAITRIFTEARSACCRIDIELDALTVVGKVAFGNITNRNTLTSGEIEIHRVLMIWQEVDGDWFVSRDFFFAEQDLLLTELEFAPSIDEIDTMRIPRRRGMRPQAAARSRRRVDS